jgi:glycerol uptake facilitator protein
MTPFVGEFVGTSLLILLGQGVVSNVVLNKSKGQNGGWIVISFGWAIAVFLGVICSASASGAHLSPAITLMMAANGGLPWAMVPVYVAGQMLGAMTGSLLAWLSYRDHFKFTEDADAKLAIFCTGPAIRNPLNNFITELIGTFALCFGVLCFDFNRPSVTLGPIGALPVSLIVLGVGLSLGGPTGYAINPARDLGPRIMHAILPIPGKRNSDWSYAWVPVLGPLAGALIAVGIFKLVL